LVDLHPAPPAKGARVHPLLPVQLTEDLARLIGLYVGNGNINRWAVHVAVCADDPDVVDWLVAFWACLGVQARLSTGRNCTVVTAHCKEVVGWLEANDCHKKGQDPGSPSVHVPKGILRPSSHPGGLPLRLLRG
jgi:hypothetical protein